jgi:Tol biopolymer transport system component
MSLSGMIAFSFRVNNNSDIWTLSIESGQLQKITSGPEVNTFPRFSPDGSRIAYLSMGADYIRSLWVMDRDGRNQVRLTKDVHAEHPSWSPDGKKILFTGNAENPDEMDICLFDLSLNSYEVLFSRPGFESEPDFSPDGEKIIFASIDPHSSLPFANRDTDIWERDLERGSERKICSHPARDYAPVYSPDGSKIAFISHRNGRSEEEMSQKLKEIQSLAMQGGMESVDAAISELKLLEMDSEVCVVNADGSNFRQLTSNKGCDVEVRWSPCGRYLTFVSSAGSSDYDKDLKIIDADSGQEMDFRMDRAPLEKERAIEDKVKLNTSLFWNLVPDFIEKPYKMRHLSAVYWGEIHSPDWSSVSG